MIYHTQNVKETEELAGKFASTLKGGEVVCLNGDLGAGKTTFSRGLINYYIPGKRVLSPTFIIVRHYKTRQGVIKNIFHLDLYRMKFGDNWSEIGLDEFPKIPASVIIIEWADRMGLDLPKKRIDIKIGIEGNDKRVIEIKSRKYN